MKTKLSFLIIALIGASNPLVAATVNIPATLTTDITVSAGDEATITGTVSTGGYKITVASGGTLTVAGSLTVASGGTVTVASGGTVTVDRDGTVTVQNGGSVTLSGALTNNGLLNLNQGTITTNSGATVNTPGMIVVGGNITKPDGVVPTGFFKAPELVDGTPTGNYYIDTYGNCEWTTWHNQFLTGDAPVQLRTGAGTLTVPSEETLVLDDKSYLSIGGTLHVEDGGTVTVNSTHTFDGAAYEVGHINLIPNSTLTIEEGGKVELEQGNLHAATANTAIYNSGELVFKTAGNYINNLLAVTGKGKVAVSGSSAHLHISTGGSGQGSLWVETADGRVEVTGGGKLTTEPPNNTTATSTILNDGLIEISGSNSQFTNNTENIAGTGRIAIANGAGATWTKTPAQHVVANLTGRSIAVYGENSWTTALQDYIASVDTIKLVSSADRLSVPTTAALNIPEGKTLTIEGGSAPGAITGSGAITNNGLLVLQDFPLANITQGVNGFVQTSAGNKKTITVYEAGAWTLQLQTVFNSNADTLVIPEGATLDFSGYNLTIPSGKVLRNEGTLTGDSRTLYVFGGTLYKGKTGSITGTLNASGGKINIELNPDWVKFPEKPYNNNLFVVAIGTDTLKPGQGQDYTEGDPTTDGKVTITGVKASANGKTGYYGVITKGYKAVADVTLNKTTLSLAVDSTFQLRDTVKPVAPDSVNPNVIWESDDEDVATVSTTGLVTAVAKGTAKITVKSVENSAATDECEVTVTLPVDSVRLTAARTTIVGRDTAHLTVAVYPNDANDSINWTTSATFAKVLTAPLRVQITGDTVKQDTLIYVYAASPEGKQDSVAIKVIPVPVGSVTIAAHPKDTLQIGDTLKLTATIPDSAYNKAVTWTSGAPTIAAVNDTGVVTGIAAGENVKIYATSDADPTKQAIFTIRKVYAVAVSGVAIEGADTVSIAKGNTLRLIANVEPAGANNTGFSWRSQNEDVAVVDEEGLVTAKDSGFTSIEVRATATFRDTVYIKVYTVGVKGITIDYAASEAKLDIRDTLLLIATVTPDNATDKTVIWTSGADSVASVDANGKVTAVSAGETSIYATSVDGGYKESVKIKVSKVDVTSVAIGHKPDNDSLQIDSTWQLVATITPAKATDTAVVWTSDKPEIATVDETGLVTGVSAGKTYITLTSHDLAGSKKESFELTVYAVPADSVRITDKDIIEADSLKADATLALKATVYPANATNKAVIWSSSDESIATVADGTVTGVSAGEAVIYVTTTEGGKKDSVAIKVYTISVESVKITAAADSLAIDSSLQLTATILPEDVNVAYAVEWSSSAPDVASVAQDGKVTAVGAGKAVIYVTVTSEGVEYKDSLALKVYTIAVSGVTIAEAPDSLGIGDKLQLSATVAPANATDPSITWSSGKPEVATVADGLVTAVAVGEATIYVTTVDGEYKDSLTIKVYPIRVEGVTIAAAGRVAVGATLQLNFTVKPDNATNKDVTWSSSDDAVAAVDDAGLVTGVSAGDAFIYVTTVDGGLKDSVTITVYAISVEGVTIENEALSLVIGATQKLTATVKPDNATEKAVVWTSGNEAVAVVSENGWVTAVAAGEAFIYVTTVDGGLKDSIAIVVHTIPVEGVTIESEALSLVIGETHELTATVTPDNATDKAVVWTSGNEAVAVVSENGRVTAVAAGEAFIYVTTVDGEHKDSVAVEVYAIPVSGVTIADAATTLPIGSTLQLTATVTPDNATDKAVVWTSGNEEVAVVSESGRVTGVAEGEALIYVTTVDGEHKDSVAITVHTVPVKGVTIAVAADSLAVGDSLQLTATVTPDNATDKAVIWESSDEAVAVVSESGRVTGVAAGEALIYVTTVDGGYMDSIVVEIYAIPVEGVTIAGAADSLATGDTLELTATVTPANATDKAVIWTSGDEEVAVVSEDGRVTGVAAGEATIYVTTVDGEHKDSVTIAVYTIPVPVEGVTIAEATDSLAKDSTLQLIAVILPEGANVDYETAWASSADSVATVDSTGLVTGVADGEVTIYVTVITEDSVEYKDSVTIAVYTVIVVPKITKVAIESEGTTLTIVTRPAGEEYDYGTLQLEAVVTTEGEGEVDYVVAWTSSDEDVAVVDEEGWVTAVAEGAATITLTVTETATGEEFTDELTITITTVGIAPVPASSVKAYIADNTLYVNSAVTEKVDIYTIGGKLAYSAVKPAGEVQIPLTGISDGVLIIRGASGWVRKVVK